MRNGDKLLSVAQLIENNSSNAKVMGSKANTNVDNMYRFIKKSL